MADLIESLNALSAKVDRLALDVAQARGTTEADAREIRTAIAGLTDALIDLTASVAALDKDAAVRDGKGDERAKTLERMGETLAKLATVIEQIATPILAAEKARIEADANKQHLFSQVTPQRLAWIVAFVMSIAAAGGFGANFRGCGAVIQTTADQQSATPEE